METQSTSRQELWTMLVLVGIVIPLFAIGIVGGYGFLVWMYQLVAGPPTG